MLVQKPNSESDASEQLESEGVLQVAEVRVESSVPIEEDGGPAVFGRILPDPVAATRFP